MNNSDVVKEIETRYRAYCDVCQSGQLDKVHAFWQLPALFIIDSGEPETLQEMVNTPAELIKLYGTQFGASTGVTETVIDRSEVTLYSDNVATFKTYLRHLAGSKHLRCSGCDLWLSQS